MKLILLSEATAGRRKVNFFATDSVDGVSPKTGLSFSGSDLQVRKCGGSYANAANSGTVADRGDGEYELELSSGEVDTFGIVSLKLEKSGVVTRLWSIAQVIAINIYDTVRAGLTALPNAAAEAAGGLYTRGTGAGQINQDANGRIDARAAAISTGAINAASIATDAAEKIADFVWDELLTGHVAAGSFGRAIGVALGLMHHNARIDGGAGAANVVFTSGVLTAARVRVFASAAAANAATAGAADGADGEVYRFAIVATETGGLMGNYKLTQTL